MASGADTWGPFERTYGTYGDTYGTYVSSESQLDFRTDGTHAHGGGQGHSREPSAAALDAAEAGGAPALRRDRRARRARADQEGLRVARRPRDRGRPVRAARRQRGRRARRQDARRDQQPVRQPGCVPGRDDGARAERAATGSSRSSTRLPPTFPTADAWIDAPPRRRVGAGPRARRRAGRWTTARCGRCGSAPCRTACGATQVSRPSMDEHAQTIDALEQAITGALDHFGVTLREGTTANDVACALASVVEGVWLNQCLTTHHPCDPAEPIATAAPPVRPAASGAARSSRPAERSASRSSSETTPSTQPTSAKATIGAHSQAPCRSRIHLKSARPRKRPAASAEERGRDPARSDHRPSIGQAGALDNRHRSIVTPDFGRSIRVLRPGSGKRCARLRGRA